MASNSKPFGIKIPGYPGDMAKNSKSKGPTGKVTTKKAQKSKISEEYDDTAIYPETLLQIEVKESEELISPPYTCEQNDGQLPVHTIEMLPEKSAKLKMKRLTKLKTKVKKVDSEVEFIDVDRDSDYEPRAKRKKRKCEERNRGKKEQTIEFSVFCSLIEDIPKGHTIEVPLNPAQVRRFPSPSRPSTSSATSLWSSMASILPETTSTADRTPVAETSEQPIIITICSAPPSPAMHVTCGQSENSSSASCNYPRVGQKRSSTGLLGASAKQRKRIPSASPSGSRPMRDKETSKLGYGSEPESDDGLVFDEDDMEMPPAFVPRTARMAFEEVCETIDAVTTNANLCFEWPPRPQAHDHVEPEWLAKPAAAMSPPACLPPLVPIEPTAATVPYEPTTKFDFKWRAFPQSQIDPKLRREPFCAANCGPTVRLDSPYEAFTAIWDREIMEKIAIETNTYAQQLAAAMLSNGTIQPSSRITMWVDTDVNELYVYFALTLATGVVVKSRLEEYWNTAKDTFITPGFKASMTYNRYLLLNKCIHFRNNEECDVDTMTRSEAKLFKIQPILDHLNRKFSELYNMSQNVALDESLTMWKGWLDINQFIRNKAASVGIKTYEVCESASGYLWRFEVHAGHTNNPSPQDPVSGVVTSLVLRLLEGLEHKGHTIWMDNFYNSPALARELKCRGFDCVGTLRTNRLFVPEELKYLKKSDMAVGQVSGCTSGDVDLIVWRDNSCVGLISTYHGLATAQCGDKLKPTLIPDYNICMGGVDRKDQMLAMYPIERRRNKIWYKKFFRRLLNASTLNSYILLKSQKSITHRSFRKTLVEELISKHTVRINEAPSSSSLQHFPALFDCIPGKGAEKYRKNCRVCKKRTNSFCKACDVPLCAFTCFEPHHTGKRY